LGTGMDGKEKTKGMKKVNRDNQDIQDEKRE
jgi:hypothetical protein